MTDRELASGVAEGKLEFLRELIDRYHRPLYRYLTQAGAAPEDAEDLASQALLRARSDAASYRGQGTLRSWTFRIAYRELLRYRRRQAVSRLLPWANSERQARPAGEDEIVLATALEAIPVDQRSAFLLTEVEGLTIEEAAIALGIPAGTVKSRCHHARLRLRKILGPTYGETNAEPAAD